MDANKRKEKIQDKIEDLNSIRAMIREDIKDLKKRKHEINEKKYNKLMEKYEKKLEKIKEKIKKLEEELEELKHLS